MILGTKILLSIEKGQSLLERACMNLEKAIKNESQSLWEKEIWQLMGAKRQLGDSYQALKANLEGIKDVKTFKSFWEPFQKVEKREFALREFLKDHPRYATLDDLMDELTGGSVSIKLLVDWMVKNIDSFLNASQAKKNEAAKFLEKTLGHYSIEKNYVQDQPGLIFIRNFADLLSGDNPRLTLVRFYNQLNEYLYNHFDQQGPRQAFSDWDVDSFVRAALWLPQLMMAFKVEPEKIQNVIEHHKPVFNSDQRHQSLLIQLKDEVYRYSQRWGKAADVDAAPLPKETQATRKKMSDLILGVNQAQNKRDFKKAYELANQLWLLREKHLNDDPPIMDKNSGASHHMMAVALFNYEVSKGNKKLNPDVVEKVIALLKEAIAIEPLYANSYAMLVSVIMSDVTLAEKISYLIPLAPQVRQILSSDDLEIAAKTRSQPEEFKSRRKVFEQVMEKLEILEEKYNEVKKTSKQPQPQVATEEDKQRFASWADQTRDLIEKGQYPQALKIAEAIQAKFKDSPLKHAEPWGAYLQAQVLLTQGLEKRAGKNIQGDQVLLQNLGLMRDALIDLLNVGFLKQNMYEQLLNFSLKLKEVLPSEFVLSVYALRYPISQYLSEEFRDRLEEYRKNNYIYMDLTLGFFSLLAVDDKKYQKLYDDFVSVEHGTPAVSDATHTAKLLDLKEIQRLIGEAGEYLEKRGINSGVLTMFDYLLVEYGQKDKFKALHLKIGKLVQSYLSNTKNRGGRGSLQEYEYIQIERIYHDFFKSRP